MERKNINKERTTKKCVQYCSAKSISIFFYFLRTYPYFLSDLVYLLVFVFVCVGT